MAQLPAVRITEQPIYCQQRVRLIVRVVDFQSIFAKNGPPNLVLSTRLVLVPVPESKGSYFGSDRCM